MERVDGKKNEDTVKTYENTNKDFKNYFICIVVR